MDVLNEEKLRDVVVSPALDRLQTAILPALEGVMHRQAALLTEELETVLANVLTSASRTLMAVEASLATDAGKLVASLDGWTATITITLNKPSLPGVLGPQAAAMQSRGGS